MRDLLTKNERNLLELIETIEQNKVYTFTFMEKKLGINSRTLYNLIEEFNVDFSPLKIAKDEFGQILIHTESNYSIKAIYQKILSNNLSFNILENLFFQQLSLNQLSDSVHVSLSTLRRNITLMNKTLKNEGFYINFSPVRIEGDEKSICNFIIHYIIEKYGNEKKYFPEKDINFAYQLLDITTRLKKIELPYSDKQKVVIWVLVGIKRSKLKKKTLEPIPDEKNIFIYLKKIFKFEIHNNMYIQLLNFLFQERINNRYQTIVREAKENTSIHDRLAAIEELLATTCSIFSLSSPENKNELIEKLYFITEVQFGKPYVLFNSDFVFYKRMSEDVSSNFELLYKEIKKIFMEHNIFLQDYQVLSYLYNLAINWDNFFSQIINAQKQIHVSLFLPSDYEYAKLIKEYINYKLPNLFEIKIIDMPQKINNTELVITDLSCLEYQGPIYSIIGLPSDTDLDWLKRFYIEMAQSSS